MFVTAVALSAAAGLLSPAAAQPPLAVPYLPQTEALCGGAAAAMVMRFWGERDVYAEAFAPLVDRSAGGIHTSALAGALDARGWRTIAVGGDLERLSQEVGRGRPVIALIEDRPGRFHYVVVVAASPSGPVIVHDPARAPSRAIDARTFDAKWQKADRWMLIVLPGAHGVAPRTPASDVRVPSRTGGARKPSADRAVPGVCEPQLQEGVALAQRGEKERARRLLESAAAACPRASAPWRELAGLDALDGRWDEASIHARRAVSEDPYDELAWRVLATADYLRHDDLAALAAWNRIGEPRTDLVEVNGLAHTRYGVIAGAIGARPRELLTPDVLRVGQKRVRDVPAVATARVTFRPLDEGEAQVVVTVVERARAPVTYPAWLGIGFGAAVNSELATSFVNVTGGGDAVDLSWRWWEHRPKIAASYSAPGPAGIWRLEASKETQTFGATHLDQTRTHAGVELGSWINQRLRLTGGAALDRWSDRARTAAVSARAEVWPVLDLLAVDGGVTGWSGSDGRFGAADARVRWRSKAASTATVWLANGGYRFASSAAPASIWPGADSGHARDVLLRAHPLLDDGVIEGGVFGRRVAFAGVERQHWLPPLKKGLVRIAPAVFLDVARATEGLQSSDRRWQYDAGLGVRLSIAGLGVLRLDVAHGLRDGRTALSAGWVR